MNTTRRPAVGVVLGTRPELIKLAPVVHALDERGADTHLIHTGQHYDDSMSAVFLAGLGLPEPALILDVGGLSRGAQIGRATEAVEDYARTVGLEAIVVQGDTNATVAGALAANALGIPSMHVEAGLRSHDRAMPEEHNRVIVDHVCDLAFAATVENEQNLRAEGIPESRIAITGNTVVAAVESQLPDAADRAETLARHGVTADRFVLATIHRPENTDDREKLSATLTGLGELARDGWTVLLPLHPRTRGAVTAAGLTDLLDALQVTEPLDYRTFLSLAAHAALLVSDSGGVQEEVTVLKRPLVVVRRSTERPEAMPDFAVLVGPDGLAAAAREWLGQDGLYDRLRTIASPFGDETAPGRIADLVLAACRD